MNFLDAHHLETKHVRIDSLQEELSTLQNDHEVSLQEIMEKTEALAEVQGGLKKLEAAAKVDLRKIEQLEFDLQSSKSDKVMVENQVEALKQKIESSNAARERIQHATDKLKADMNKVPRES